MKTTALATLLLLLGTSLAGTCAFAKNMTIEQRQSVLMKEINGGQKSKELTVKEAKKLRKMLADVSREKARLMGKTFARKLTHDDQKSLESMLNDVSVTLKKLELEKRVKKD